MKIKPLSETNPYLRDPVERERLVTRSVRTSCAVEGIKPRQDKTLVIEIKHRKPKQIYNTTE